MRGNPFFILLMLPSLVWVLGTSIFALEIREEFWVFMASILIVFFIYLLIVFIISFRRSNEYIDLSSEQIKGLTQFLKLSLLVLSASTAYFLFKFYLLSESGNYDAARFEIRMLPGTGFLSRVNYWWPIVLAPILSLLQEQAPSQKKLYIVAMVILFIAEAASGSKAGVVWLSLVLVFSRYVFFRKGVHSKKSMALDGVMVLLTPVVIMVFLFAFFSASMINKEQKHNSEASQEQAILQLEKEKEKAVSSMGFNQYSYYLELAANGLKHRLSYGAVEGLSFVQKYYDENGNSFLHFTIERPVNLLAASFRLIEKSYYNVDSGVYLARYYKRDNDAASYTFSWAGLSYLAGGKTGVILGMIAMIGVILLLQFFTVTRHDPIGILCIIPYWAVIGHFIDWGWVDGILVFSIIYIALLQFLLWLFLRRLKLTHTI